MFLKTDGAGNLSFSSDLPTTSFTGATAETSIADADLVLIYDDSATAVRKMTKANLVAGIGGANTPAFSAYINSTNTGTNNTYTKCKFDTELYDTDNAYDPTTNYRFTVPSGKAGKYHFSVSFMSYETTANNNINSWQTALYKNGSNTLFVAQTEGASVGAYRINVLSSDLDLAVGDYIEVYFRANATSGTIQVEAGSSYSRFSGYRLIGV